jgi:hypothetical protein
MAHEGASQAHRHALMFFSGEDFDPDRVSNLLSLQPSHAKRKGEPVALPRPGRPAPLARKGVLSYSTLSLQSNDINDHFRYLLQAILPVASEVKSLVERDHLSWEIVCFFDDPPPDLRAALDPSIANRLDEFGIELLLDDPNTITVVEET